MIQALAGRRPSIAAYPIWQSAVYGLVVMACCLPSENLAAGDYGVNGIFDVPTARMDAEGTLTATLSGQEIADIYTVSYQVTPWAEAAFRYSIFNPRRLEQSGDEQKDRSFEAKVRLFSETRTRPEVSVGARDLLGTGIWSGEYLVASKRWGGLDLTLGFGWGRLAQRSALANPLAEIGLASGGERTRTVEGGDFALSNYFSGDDVGLFGGFTYALPWRFKLLGEYNTDRYDRERSFGTVGDTSPFSVGLEWEPLDDVSVAVSWQHGDQLGLRISSKLDTAVAPLRKRPNGFGAGGMPPIGHRRLASDVGWYARLVSDAENSGVLIRSANDVTEDTLAVVYTNQAFQLEADAIRRVLNLVELYAPSRFRRVIAVSEQAEIRSHAVHYVRNGRAKWARPLELPVEAHAVRILPPLEVQSPAYETNFRFPNFSNSLSLGTRTYLFDPDRPFRYQIYARVSSDVDFGRGWGLTGSWIQNIANDFDGITRKSDSLLPRVRSDISTYLREGESGVDRLVLTKRGSLSPSLHYQAFAGILEEMYGGVGVEALYKPFGSSVAFGANVIYAQQRDFDRSLRFRDFETITGHMSAYWATPFYDFDVKLHAGRYLARDWGVTLEIQKELPNGWSVGVFASQTDVSAAEFGEGSFDKGLTLRIPLNMFTRTNTRSSYGTIIRPLQRDGGQRIEAWGTSLWGMHRSTTLDHLVATKARMVPN